MLHSFDQFMESSSTYATVYHLLAERNPLQARSARTVVELQGCEQLKPLAEFLIPWARDYYGEDFLDRYLHRLFLLENLQQSFDAAPCLAKLGDPTLVVDRSTYDCALLLSLIFSNHRFELLRSLQEFLRCLPTNTGRIACVGVGTGYELFVASRVLSDWSLEGYDTDPQAQKNARNLLSRSLPGRSIQIADYFPLTTVSSDFRNSLDAIVMCELLEHLQDPLTALKAAREYLTPGGRMFVTMAINLAQEDHVFLYPNVSSCRRQLLIAGLSIVQEWLIPVIVHPSQLRRVIEVERGNYCAVVIRRDSTVLTKYC